MVGRDPMQVEMRWTPKHRGPEFPTLALALDVVRGPLQDGRGRRLTTVVARPLSEGEEAAVAKAVISEDLALLKAMLANDGGSLGRLATILGDGWSKSKVQRKLEKFAKRGWVEKDEATGSWRLTSEGRAKIGETP
jgi:hypothetical protein